MRPPDQVVHTCPGPTSGLALSCYFFRSSYTAIRTTPSTLKHTRYSSGCEHGHRRFPGPRNQSPIAAEAGPPFAASASALWNLPRGNCIDADLSRR